MFGLKYKESFSYCVLGTEKVWKYFMFITGMVNKLNHFGRSIDSSMWNYKLLIKRTLSAINFCLVKKIQPKKRSLFKQNVNLIEQKLKFAVFCLYYFCTILYLLFAPMFSSGGIPIWLSWKLCDDWHTSKHAYNCMKCYHWNEVMAYWCEWILQKESLNKSS